MLKRALYTFIIVLFLASCGAPVNPNSTSDNSVFGGSIPTYITLTSTVPDSQNLTSALTSTPINPQNPSSSPTSTPIVMAIDETSATLADSLYGLQIHKLSSEEQLSLSKQMGAKLIRTDIFHWDDIEPISLDPPVYDWTSVDETGLRMAVESGFMIIGIVLYAPEWAQKYPGIACGPVSNEAMDDFANFMGALVSRYSQPPYNIHIWEIGNEPDIDRSLVPPDMFFGCWGEIGDTYYGGRYYGEMLKTVYPAIKAADPDAQVLVGGLNLDCDPIDPPENPAEPTQKLYCIPALFLEGIMISGGGDYFDGVSFHAYDYYKGDSTYGNSNWQSDSSTIGPVLIKKSRYINDLLATYGYSKLLINTELALLCGSNGSEPACSSEDFSTTKANYIAQAYPAALAEGLSGNIWYSLTGWRASGLVNDSLQPNIAYVAYMYSEAMLGNAQFVREITDFPGVKGYEFSREVGNIWILWSSVSGEQQVQLPGTPQKVSNVIGDPLAVEQNITVSLSPVYIEWTPEQ